MNQDFEQNIPILPVALGFLLLLILILILRKKLRKRYFLSEGQLSTEGGRIPSIEERLAGNREWASGVIKSKGSFLALAIWLGVVVWNLTFGVSFYKSFSNPDIKTGGQIVLGIFTLMVIPLIVFAIRLTIRQFKFGQSSCIISGKAGVLGKVLSGNIRTKTELAPTGDYTIELQCLELYEVGSGKNRKTEINMHWNAKQSVPYSGKNSRAGIPFSFEIPTYPPETGYQLARGKINWQLNMHAPVKGVDYSALFVVPVFKMD